MDDDQGMRDFLLTEVCPCIAPGAQVHLAKDGAEAIAKIRRIADDTRNEVLLIISDDRMGGAGKDGHDFYRAVRAIDGLGNTPFIMVSGNPYGRVSHLLPPAHVTDGYFGFVQKPFDVDRLLAVVREKVQASDVPIPVPIAM